MICDQNCSWYPVESFNCVVQFKLDEFGVKHAIKNPPFCVLTDKEIFGHIECKDYKKIKQISKNT